MEIQKVIVEFDGEEYSSYLRYLEKNQTKTEIQENSKNEEDPNEYQENLTLTNQVYARSTSTGKYKLLAALKSKGDGQAFIRWHNNVYNNETIAYDVYRMYNLKWIANAAGGMLTLIPT
ncbi:hypothetical protein FDI69_gp126 [Rhodococcus phage Trina]|uniref:Uncharacterized protein n=1 Tax=Rhodococcus phage Trina TaxID=2027905 RepID=A0A2D0ZN88_9CAUD|nr:hypothetical protein FDI69_gp126 [Rhodococcus phage Trina]ASZ75059.1 hypothetical protein SEA_TRINA_281 [Rhodococcus phage Trina]